MALHVPEMHHTSVTVKERESSFCPVPAPPFEPFYNRCNRNLIWSSSCQTSSSSSISPLSNPQLSNHLLRQHSESLKATIPWKHRQKSSVSSLQTSHWQTFDFVLVKCHTCKKKKKARSSTRCSRWRSLKTEGITTHNIWSNVDQTAQLLRAVCDQTWML